MRPSNYQSSSCRYNLSTLSPAGSFGLQGVVVRTKEFKLTGLSGINDCHLNGMAELEICWPDLDVEMTGEMIFRTTFCKIYPQLGKVYSVLRRQWHFERLGRRVRQGSDFNVYFWQARHALVPTIYINQQM